MLTSKSLTLALCASLITLGGCNKLKSRDQMNQGVQAFKNNKYADAVKHFKEAVEYDPGNQNAQLYLATSYMIQWVPGADSPDNLKNYSMAKQEFQKVLQRDPKDPTALDYMAAMAFQSASAGTPEQKKAALQEAKQWNIRREEAYPKDPEPYYYLGVIAWTEAFGPIQTARVNSHMKPDDPGPLKDAKEKDELRSQYEKTIEDGMTDLRKCLDLDKENEDAMSYLNLLLREKAVLEDNPDAAKSDIAQAEAWSNKSLDMKRIKASRPAKNTAAS